jgi:hypothetical protein
MKNSQKLSACHSCKCRNLLNTALLLNFYSDACQEHLIFLTFCDSVKYEFIVLLESVVLEFYIFQKYFATDKNLMCIFSKEGDN